MTLIIGTIFPYGIEDKIITLLTITERRLDMEINILGILVTHDPPESVSTLIQQMLEICTNVVVVDSSRDTSFIPNDIRDNHNFNFIHETKHLGLGHALNTAISLGGNIRPDYAIVMEDDALLVNLHRLVECIVSFVKSHTYLDLLYFSESGLKGESDFIQLSKPVGSASGLFLSFTLLFSLKFREELFIDQMDIDFQYRVKEIGGKIFQTREVFNSRLPVGRYTIESGTLIHKRDLHTLPPWRYYLLVRNTLTLFAEGKIGILSLSYVPGYFFKGLLAKQKPSLLFYLLIKAGIDAIKHNLGITSVLLRLRPDLH